MRFELFLNKRYLVLPYSYNASPREVGFYKEDGEVITSLLLEYDENPNDKTHHTSLTDFSHVLEEHIIKKLLDIFHIK